MTEPLRWPNSTLLSGDVAAVRELKKVPGDDLHVMGSDALIRSLSSASRLFADGFTPTTLHLIDTTTTTTGVVIATYRLAGDQ